MKRVSFILLMLLMCYTLPCLAEEELKDTEETPSVVFVYHIPDDEQSSSSEEISEEPVQDIVSDDVTEDTFPDQINTPEDDEDDDIQLYYYDEDGGYEVGDMYSDVLKGYAEYHEGEEDEVVLNSENYLSLNIKQPQSVGIANYTQLKTTPLKFYDNSYSKFYIPEFSIKPVSSSNYKEFGDIRVGTTYSQYIDTGELEQTSGIFSSYKYKNLTLKTTYAKTVNTTNNTYTDKIFFSPEWKINQYFTLGQNFSTDLVKGNKKAEIVLSINPLGKKDEELMRFDFGVSQSYSETSNTFKNQFRFATRFNF